MPHTKINAREMPVSEYVLKQICAREKTINHIIYNLTKR